MTRRHLRSTRPRAKFLFFKKKKNFGKHYEITFSRRRRHKLFGGFEIFALQHDQSGMSGHDKSRRCTRTALVSRRVVFDWRVANSSCTAPFRMFLKKVTAPTDVKRQTQSTRQVPRQVGKNRFEAGPTLFLDVVSLECYSVFRSNNTQGSKVFAVFSRFDRRRASTRGFDSRDKHGRRDSA